MTVGNYWGRANIKLTTPGKANGLAKDCATGPGKNLFTGTYFFELILYVSGLDSQLL